MARATACSAGPEERVLVRDFFGWCAALGADVRHLDLRRDAERGLGLYTTRAIQAGDAAVSAPTEVLLTVPRAVRSEVGRAALQSRALQGCPVSAQAVMYLVMIDGRARADSFWHPWLRLLPTAYSDPLWWRPEERASLAGTQAAHEAARHEAQLRDVYDGLFPALSEELPETFPRERYGFDAFLWARSSLSSRSFAEVALGSRVDKPLTSEERSRLRQDCPAFMCPLLDFTNHDASLEVRVGLAPRGEGLEVALSAGRDFSASGEVLNNYGGCRTNLQLLLGYGFCVEGNPADSLPLRLGAPPLSSRLRAALRESGLSFEEVHEATRAEPLPRRMLALLRLAVGGARGVKGGSLEALCRPLPPRRRPGEPEVLAALRRQLLQKRRVLAVPCAGSAALYRRGQLEIVDASLRAVSSAKLAWSRHTREEAEEERPQERDEEVAPRAADEPPRKMPRR